MLHLHILQLALLTFELLVLTAAISLLIYVNKQMLSKWYRYTCCTIVTLLAVIIILTIAHPLIRHIRGGHSGGFHHNKSLEKHHNQGDYEHENHHGEEGHH